MITGQVPSVAASLKKEGGWLRMIGQMKSLLVVVQIRKVHTIIDTGTATTNRSHNVLLVGFLAIIIWALVPNGLCAAIPLIENKDNPLSAV